MTTNIYELCDPSSGIAFYVGKGGGKRSSSHWNIFLRTGKAVNRLLAGWFEILRKNDLEPYIRIRETVSLLNWEAREKYWISYWKKRNEKLCNLHKGGNAPSSEECKLGGIAGARRLHELYPGFSGMRGKKHPNPGCSMRGKRHSAATIRRMKRAAKGRKVSLGTARKMIRTKLKQNAAMSPEERRAKFGKNRGKHIHTKKRKRELSLLMRGNKFGCRKQSLVERKERSESAKNYWGKLNSEQRSERARRAWSKRKAIK